MSPLLGNYQVGLEFCFGTPPAISSQGSRLGFRVVTKGQLKSFCNRSIQGRNGKSNDKTPKLIGKS